MLSSPARARLDCVSLPSSRLAVGICRLGGNSDDETFHFCQHFTYSDQGSLVIILIQHEWLLSSPSSKSESPNPSQRTWGDNKITWYDLNLSMTPPTHPGGQLDQVDSKIKDMG